MFRIHYSMFYALVRNVAIEFSIFGIAPTTNTLITKNMLILAFDHHWIYGMLCVFDVVAHECQCRCLRPRHN